MCYDIDIGISTPSICRYSENGQTRRMAYAKTIISVTPAPTNAREHSLKK